MLVAPVLVSLLAVDTPSNPPVQIVQLDVQGMAALLGLFVPLLVALVTKKYSSNALKGIVNVLASAAVAVIAIWAQYNGHVTWWAVVNAVIVSLVTSIGSYQAFWKNVNLNDKLLPQAGIGKAVANPDNPGVLK